MGLLENKSWVAQDLYNEYLLLKNEISDLMNYINILKQFNKDEGAKKLKSTADVKIKRFKFILNQLKLEHGIKMEDLILLSIGVDV